MWSSTTSPPPRAPVSTMSYLGREVAAGLELLEGDGHGVGPEEQDEGHEGQVRDILTGAAH